MGLIFIKRYFQIFHSHSIVCSRVACQQALFWYYFQLVLKFCWVLEFDCNNLNEWSVQNTTCDFFSFFSYLKRTTQDSPFSLQRKLNIILSACTVLLCYEDSDFGWHLPLKNMPLHVLLQTWNWFWVCLSIFEKMAFLSHLWPSLIFLGMNNLEVVLCHSLSCQSSVLVFTFHLKFYYLWVHWLLLLSWQKCFKSSASTFFFLAAHIRTVFSNYTAVKLR